MCADFSIGGYGLGGSIKHGLLQREDREHEESAEVKMDGKILLLSPVKRPRKAELSKIKFTCVVCK